MMDAASAELLEQLRAHPGRARLEESIVDAFDVACEGADCPLSSPEYRKLSADARDAWWLVLQLLKGV